MSHKAPTCKPARVLVALLLAGVASPFLSHAESPGWIGPETTQAEGGDTVFDIERTGTNYRVHVFTEVGDATFQVVRGGTFDLLVVGGGGGGGGSMTRVASRGSGGGAGGLVFAPALTIGDNTSIAVTVGSGGAGGCGTVANTPDNRGSNGSNSVFGAVVALGGGGGNSLGQSAGDGGSGGGGGGLALQPASPSDGLGQDGGAGADFCSGGGAGAPGGGFNTQGGRGTNAVTIAGTPYAFDEVFGTCFGQVLAGSPWFAGGGASWDAAGGWGGGGSARYRSDHPSDVIHGLPNTGGGGAGTHEYVGGGGRGGSGIVMVRYAIEPGAEPLVLADIQTGSREFTNSNVVEVVSFPVPAGYDRFQVRGTGDVAAIDPGAWTNVTEAPPQIAFARPAADQVVTLYTWFTNATESVTARRALNTVVYTETPPVIAADAVVRRPIDGFTVRLTHPDELDLGSTGGRFEDRTIPIHSRDLRFDGAPALNQTPSSSFFTFNAPGDYPFTFRVMNAAGTVAEQPFTLQIRADTLPAGNRFVAVGNLNAATPFNTWTTAAAAIRDAVAAADADDLIQVAPGCYQATQNPVILLDRPVRLRGVWGPRHVSVDGQSLRKLMATHADLGTGRIDVDGFTFRNGELGADQGGALRLADFGPESVIRNSIIRDSAAKNWGGGIIVTLGSAGQDILLENCVIQNNRSQWGGGFLMYNTPRSAHLRNCLIADNQATSTGGGVMLIGSSPQVVIESSTIIRNRCEGGGGGVRRQYAGTLSITNSIVIQNSAPAAENLVQNHFGVTTWSHSLTGPYLQPGAGNLATDPLFADFAGGDFRLTRESPARNTGTNLPWMAGAVDLDGRPRLGVHNGVVDMGCYELPPVGSVLLLR